MTKEPFLPTDSSVNPETYVCPVELARLFDNPFRRLFHNPTKMLSKYVKPGMHVMDFGSGLGYFSIGMAKLVGEHGCVYSVDIQRKMLDTLCARAAKNNLLNIIQPVLCQASQIELGRKVDFVLAFWMMHEVIDVSRTLEELLQTLNSGGILFIAEPIFHVKITNFYNMIAEAVRLGFKVMSRPKIGFSYGVVLES